MKKRWAILNILVVFNIVAIAWLGGSPAQTVHGAPVLTITPITWDVIGLDSNDVNVGPNVFPVGARVCNEDATDTATHVTTQFVWDSTDSYIHLRPGSLSIASVAALAPGACTDFYYEVEITRNPAAYDHVRRYHITATADTLGVISTPTPRELYVEHLISQNRNANLDVSVDGVSIPNGGTMALMVGQTYTITLSGQTATQGYEQIENFINFPNTIFQILSVQTGYSADTSPTVDNPNSLLYGDACHWENDPNSPNYRACLSTGKTGGSVTTSYQVRILSVGSVNPQPLATLIYDFSGSSYHYNADYITSVRYAYIVDPAMITIGKNFNPDPTNAGGISTLSITLNNPTPATINGLNFSDSFPTTPGMMVVATPPNASTTGCGTPTFTPAAGSGSIAFSNGTLAPNSSCTIKVNVSVPAVGTYLNTTGNLFIGTSDTGNSASDTLTVNTAPPAPACVPNAMLAQWTLAGGVSGSATPPLYSFRASDVTTALTSYGQGLTQEIDTANGNLAPSLMLYGWAKTGPIATGTSPFYQFQVDTRHYTDVRMAFDANRKNNGPNNVSVYYSSDGATWLLDNATAINPATSGFSTHTTQATTGTSYYRIYGFGANATTRGNDLNLDNITFTGCGAPQLPTLSKSFAPDPIAEGSTSALTFTLSNPNSFALTNVRFDDTLPAGLTMTSGSTAQCGGTLTRTAPSSLAFTGGALAAGASCTLTVTVTAVRAGVYDNVSGFISADYSAGTLTNTSAAGYGSDTLAVLAPPDIRKSFSPDPILPGEVSTLTWVITNPNLNDALTDVQFTDGFPTMPGQMTVAAAPDAATTGCGAPVFTPAAGAGSISFSGGSIAPGGSCVIRVNVSAATVGAYHNITSPVQAVISGVPLMGNTAADDLTVNPPHPALAILKQVGLDGDPNGVWTKFAGVAPGTPVYYRFIVENIGDVDLTNVAVSDPTLSGTGVSLAACSWAALSRYTAEVCVVGPVAAVEGAHANTAAAQGSYAAAPVISNDSTASYATAALTLVKSVAETFFDAAGDVLHYTYQVTNSGYAPLAGPVVVSDDRSSDESCPAVETVGDLDAFLDPGESLTCIATYTVTDADVLAGAVTNLASASADGTTSNTDSETVVLTPLDTPTPTMTNTATLTDTPTSTETPPPRRRIRRLRPRRPLPSRRRRRPRPRLIRPRRPQPRQPPLSQRTRQPRLQLIRPRRLRPRRPLPSRRRHRPRPRLIRPRRPQP
ncbi:protein containg conserved repeat domain [Longilinea arvoryzae]|uniref:Protein containg conserved repeat domain n=1 Tax=Longilinea arvoryzae TaxID=360412 RepID=A0A0S7BG65_9CHLR|nr:DUF11 domain-containing protein [Longilinea arvoryzae]GAP12426.1 protein containg conserved repeat domain [Longilinea arvoryzae]